jgi:N-acylglucosamine-6-phosphate 2-epimerase
MTSPGPAPDELRQLQGGLVVSCQAREDNPLHGPELMAIMARAAVLGGARGIRANGVADVAAIRAAVAVPILGINKVVADDGSVFITPTAASAQMVIAAGARLVALDGTIRPRPGGESLASVITAIHAAGAFALADVATTADADYAVRAGADAVGTTLSGYTADSPRQDGPDFDLLAALVKRHPVPVFAEGRIWTAEQARQALDLGAAFVVVGTAITNPMATTARYVSVMSHDRGE